MSNYDGPSYFKNNHPKIEPIQAEKKSEPEKQPKYALPKNVRTRDHLKKEAREYMKTPSTTVSNDPPPERFPFKNKHIPKSLQKLGGWSQQNPDRTLLSEIQARLDKDKQTYLLFEDRLSDEMRKTLEAMESEDLEANTEPAEIVKKAETAPVDEIKEKVARIQKATTKNFMKPNTGLHRSLSNIMDEEQRGIRNSKLNSLFTEE